MLSSEVEREGLLAAFQASFGQDVAMEMEASHGGEGEGMKARASMGHVGGASGARRGRVRSRRVASGRVGSRRTGAFGQNVAFPLRQL
jgi:hypothetical protein